MLYVRPLSVDFALEVSSRRDCKTVEVGATPAYKRIARLTGALILGEQLWCDGEDFVEVCDTASGDLYLTAELLQDEGLLDGFGGMHPNVLYIESLEMDSSLIDSEQTAEFIRLIPQSIFLCSNVLPGVMCNLVADSRDYFEHVMSRTTFDVRSVNEESSQLFVNAGFAKGRDGNLLYFVVDDIACGRDDNDVSPGEDAEHDAPDVGGGPERDILDAADGLSDDLFNQDGRRTRDLLEDPIALSYGATSVMAPQTLTNQMKKYILAAMSAHDLGIRVQRALDGISLPEESCVSETYRAFQDLYFAGKRHIDDTASHLHAVGEPSAGEVFSDVALMRARNTYYVAGMLYRLGHMIEAHAMSRLLLEQIAWAFAVCDAADYEEAAKISPTKSIGRLKEILPSVGRMYGILPRYVHLPVSKHYECLTLEHGETETLLQYGEHSLAYGMLIARLADFWSVVYEYAQARHISDLEN